MAVWFGLAVLLIAYLVDLRSRAGQDFAFWGYVFGLMAFWGGLSSMESGNEWTKLAYCLINVGLIGLSVLLSRRVFAVFGAFGVLGYSGSLVPRVPGFAGFSLCPHPDWDPGDLPGGRLSEKEQGH